MTEKSGNSRQVGEGLEDPSQIALLDTLLDCKLCHDIWRGFADHNATIEINLGSFKDAVCSECPRHTLLVKRFRDYCHDRNDMTRDADDVGICKGRLGDNVTLTESISKGGRYWSLLLVKQNFVPDHVGIGRILDPDWVDLGIVKQWKAQCLASHGPKCENPIKISPIRPAWLIDTKNKCLVSGQCSGAFVALSYRWGEHSRFSIDADTMAKLRKPNALDSPEISVHLVPILRHAMYLTSAIGERYLWADALCITYGDDAAATRQRNLIGAIYASAIVTIIAADGDSQDGFLGLRDISAPRKSEQRILPFGKDKIIVRNTGMFYSSGTQFYERGWTYQEEKLSPRKILFKQKEVHWECQCNVWHEEMTLGAESEKYIDPRLGVILAGFPDLGSLANLITNYNKREFRYEEDALPGISTLLSVVSRSFTGGFLYGLPEMLFDRALGWKPIWGHINLRRRAQSDRPDSSRSSHLSLPSWSWIGWQGLVTHWYGEAARINDRQSWIEETTPITEWYTSNSPSGSPLRRIRSTWFENRDSFKDFTRPLPAGWTRHEVPANDSSEGEARLYPDGCGGQVFKHCNMPDNDCDSFYFPFPVADIQESTPPFTPDQTSYIFCETKRARLWAHQAGDQYNEKFDRNKNIVTICDKDGRSIGELHLHNEQQLVRFPKTVTNDAPGIQIELVAIYRSRKYAKTLDKEQKRYTYPHTITDSYQVLWVEWVDGVAYRLASGHVEKADWEDSDLEDVSLILH